MHKFFIIRLIYGLVVFFCLPTIYLNNAKASQSEFNDRFYSEQKYLGQINAVVVPEPINRHATTDRPVIVAIIDEGVDFAHPDLRNIQNSKGWNFLDNNNDLTPKGPHGTRLAGIIAANANNNEGIVGLSQNVKIMPLIACDVLAGCDPKAITVAIYYAADNGASIINLSFGDIAGFSEVYTAAINYAHTKGAVIVAAAGGNGYGQDLSQNPISPVCNEPVIGVSSIDENNQLPLWANFGGCVDAYVPGTNIFTATIPSYDGNLYGYYSGSSYSAAIVSGWVALLKSIKPDITYSEVTAAIKNQRLDIGASLALFAQKTPVIPKVKGASIIKKQNKPAIIKIFSAGKPKEKLR